MSTYEKTKFLLKRGREIYIQSCEPEFSDSYIEFTSQIAKETKFTMQYEGRAISEDLIKDKWIKSKNSRNSLCLCCFDEERMIGFLAIQCSQPDHLWTRHIAEFGLMILKDYCGDGLGSKLLHIMEEEAKEMKIQRIEARARTKNSDALFFYLKNGYLIEGIRKRAAYIEGTFEDEYYIAKQLYT